MTVNDIAFTPATPLTHTNNEDALFFKAPETAGSSFHQDGRAAVKVTLKDGRELNLDATVRPARPSVTLLNKNVHLEGPSSLVQLGSPDELPEHAKLTFFVQAPETFPRDQKIEIASNDDSFSTVLRVGEGGIVLQDRRTALVTLDPAKAFGGSAFGPIRFRPVSAEGVQGEWVPLVTLVRVPQLKELQCADRAAQCKLLGADLFLLQQVGSDAQLTKSVTVPEGFGDNTLIVPRPSGTLYLKLRDDPDVVNTAALPVTPDPIQAAPQPGRRLRRKHRWKAQRRRRRRRLQRRRMIPQPTLGTPLSLYGRRSWMPRSCRRFLCSGRLRDKGTVAVSSRP